jgi:hypothetical protein
MGKKIHDINFFGKSFMAEFSQYILKRFIRKSKVMRYFKIMKLLMVGITLSAIHKVVAMPTARKIENR